MTQAYHPTVGGVTEHVDATAQALRARGHHVAIITSGRSRPIRDDPPDVIRIGRNATLVYNGAESNMTIGFGLAGALRDIFDRGAYDVVHVHCPLSPSLPLLAIRAARVPVVATYHSVSESDLPFRLFRPILMLYHRRVARMLAVSEAARADLLRNFPGPVEIVPNGVDLARFRSDLPRAPRAPDEAPTILFVGRFDPRKGLPELIESCRLLRREGLRFRLVLVGDGRLRPRLERMAADGLRGWVHFEGHVPHAQLPRYYAAADVFCSPARGAESFGLVLLEAMAIGVAVVATDIPGYRTVVTHGRDGLLVPPERPAELAAALGLLLRDEELRARLGSRGVATAARYGWDRIGGELERIYLSLIGATPVDAREPEPAPPLTSTPSRS